LLGGTVLVATVITVMVQGSIAETNAAFIESKGDYSSYVEGGVNDLLANGSLVHESPAGCVYNNPPCDVGYFCNADLNVCTPITSVQLLGYVRDPSGNPLSGVTINVTGGDGSVATTDASGRYSLLTNVSVASGLYSVIASRVPANVPAGATVNLSVGYATMQNFTLSYNDASLSGYVRDSLNAGISGVNVSCGRYSVLSASGGVYSISNVPMSSDSVSCTLTGTKSPTVVSNSTPATLSAGLTNSKNLQLSYSVANLTGFVRNSSGSGINGAAVSCNGVSGTTSSSGAFALNNIAMSAASTTCTLAASSSPTFVSNSTSVALNAGMLSSGVLQLSYSNATVSGFVNDSAGVGLNGASVSCAGLSRTTSSTGAYSFSISMSKASSFCNLSSTKAGYLLNYTNVSFSAGVATSGIVLKLRVATINGACGSASGVASYTKPVANLCSVGTNSTVTGSGPWYWFCNGSYGGTNASCSAPLKADGVCGSGNGKLLTSAPTSTVACSVGSISGLTTTSSGYSWTCVGVNGGASASCAASACGTATVTFTYMGSAVTYGTIVSPAKKCFLDRNIGASRAATSISDSAAFGDLFQWGRLPDGHQYRTSGGTTTLSSSDVPGHSSFIYNSPNVAPYDWRSPQNSNLWQGVSGTNNPCPFGWRVPTASEWSAEISAGMNSYAKMYSLLKLTNTGWRSRVYNTISYLDRGFYWTSTPFYSSAGNFYGSSYMYFNQDVWGTSASGTRADGLGVRCLYN